MTDFDNLSLHIPLIMAVFVFMGNLNIMLSYVEHEKLFYNQSGHLLKQVITCFRDFSDKNLEFSSGHVD